MTARAHILIRAVDETRGAFDSVKRGLGGLADAARSVNGVLAGLGVALSAAGLGATVKSALESADALNKLSQRVGITVESLSTLVPAAELSGVSAQTLETGLKKIATAMLEAATGSEESARRFAALGVQIGGETAAQAEAFNDALAKVKLASTSIANREIEAFLPTMNEIAGGMVESAKQGGALRAILDGVVLVLKTLALGAATVGKAFVALGDAIGAGVAAAVQALRGNTAGAKAIIADLKGSLIKRPDELAEFRDSLFDPKPLEVQAPKVQADPALLQRLSNRVQSQVVRG